MVMASGWESEGPGFKPWRLQATFDPGLPKNQLSNSPPKKCAFNEKKKFARSTIKD